MTKCNLIPRVLSYSSGLRSEIERGPEEDTGNERLVQVSFTVRSICTNISSSMSGSSAESISTSVHFVLYVLLVVTEDCTGDVVEERRSQSDLRETDLIWQINQTVKKLRKRELTNFLS